MIQALSAGVISTVLIGGTGTLAAVIVWVRLFPELSGRDTFDSSSSLFWIPQLKVAIITRIPDIMPAT
jgi:hypothetical protein